MNKTTKIITSTLLVVALAIVIVASRQVYVAWGETQLANPSDQSGADPELDKINADIARKKLAIEELQRQQDAYKQALAAKQQEKADLQNQLAIFDNRLASLQASTDKLKLNIEETQLEIRKLDLEITAKENEIKRQKEQIATALSLLYKEGDKTDLEIMLMNDNLSDYIDQIKQLKDLNSGIIASLDALKAKQASLKSDREAQAQRQDSLTKLQDSLIEQQQSLGDERGAKQIVLDQTKNSEAEYQKLLAQAKREQQNAANDIANLEKSVRRKLSKNSKFTSLDTSAEGFIWPVPKNTITAYFHDPEYPFRNVFEHPAIDIRAGQGTPVRAASSGYVARAKDGGATGYSYIMLVHNDGLSTVYGHVSSISVNEEDYVTQGQVIGLSGGMPGTRGAGRLTTGAHMHFEVRLNGLPVNPLDYLQ
jgi:murein DD-endopeptidase MepM/ murein hydrolase activator NlpD